MVTISSGSRFPDAAETYLRPILLPLATMILTAHTVWSSPLRGQEPEPSEAAGAVAHVEVAAGLTRIQGDFAPLLGGAAVVELGPISLGGGGALMLQRLALPADPFFSEPTLGFGYGGLVIEYSRPTSSRGRLTLRGLVGAGNADLVDDVTGVRIESDNVFVVEPGVGVVRPLTSRLDIGIALSYRLVWSVQDLRSVGRRQLSGVTLMGSLRFGPL